MLQFGIFFLSIARSSREMGENWYQKQCTRLPPFSSSSCVCMYKCMYGATQIKPNGRNMCLKVFAGRGQKRENETTDKEGRVFKVFFSFLRRGIISTMPAPGSRLNNTNFVFRHNLETGQIIFSQAQTQSFRNISTMRVVFFRDRVDIALIMISPKHAKRTFLSTTSLS